LARSSWPPQIGELLPRSEDAYGVQEKLLNYSLKAGHPRGKAEAFARVLAVTADDLECIAEGLLSGVRTSPVSGVRPAGAHGFHCEVIVQDRRGACHRAGLALGLVGSEPTSWLRNRSPAGCGIHEADGYRPAVAAGYQTFTISSRGRVGIHGSWRAWSTR
jgi:hypothetical protein